MEHDFPSNPQHLAIAMAFVNRAMIQDIVLPRVPVNRSTFDWWEYDLADGFTIPDTKVGKFDQVGEERFKATKRAGSCENHALAEPVSQDDITNAPEGVDPLSKATERQAARLMLAREKRVADIVFDASKYPTANKDTLAGSDQFSHVDSDPIRQLKEYLDSMIMRAKVMVVGRKEWSTISQHAKVVKAVNRNDGGSGVASRQGVADLLEIEQIVVGEPFVNTAAKGQTPTMSRVWGGKIALLYLDALADNTGGLTFGYTAQFEGKVVKTVKQEDRGLKGVLKQIVGESVEEIVAASSCGFLISDVLAS